MTSSFLLSILNTWWFMTIFCLLCGGLGYLLYQRIGKTMKDRNAINEKFIWSRLTALRAQMNPHFIFNALNSIQDFILTSDSRSANKYLSHFAKLMRYVLNSSEKEWVTLKDEMNALNLYLELEALRFNHELDYSVDVDEKIQSGSTILPPLLVQPYVENAIKHGLLHKSGDKKLLIRFDKIGQELHCSIIDNGIGRKNAEALRNKHLKHHSHGMSVTQERIDLLNKVYGRNFRLNISDVTPKIGQTGTEVSLFIHDDFQKNFKN